MSTNPYKVAWQTFKALAFKKGFKEKVVGDEAFSKARRPDSKIIKLLGARNGKIQVYEEGVGRYEVEIPTDLN